MLVAGLSHATARCLDGCGDLYDGDEPDKADRTSHLHTTSKARGALHHASAATVHDRSNCARLHGWQDEWTDGTVPEWAAR